MSQSGLCLFDNFCINRHLPLSTIFCWVLNDFGEFHILVIIIFDMTLLHVECQIIFISLIRLECCCFMEVDSWIGIWHNWFKGQLMTVNPSFLLAVLPSTRLVIGWLLSRDPVPGVWGHHGCHGDQQLSLQSLSHQSLGSLKLELHKRVIKSSVSVNFIYSISFLKIDCTCNHLLFIYLFHCSFL